MANFKKRLLDKIVVIDIEATCWEKKPTDGQEREIIEVGICTLDVPSRHCERKESIIVKPEYSKISEFCTRLTTLTQEQVDQGVSLKDMCFRLEEKYLTRKRVWASYGSYDRKQFGRQCALCNVPYPFGPNHINVKNLFALFYALPEEVGMKRALAMLGLPLIGIHHRAEDDAWNISKILAALITTKRN